MRQDWSPWAVANGNSFIPAAAGFEFGSDVIAARWKSSPHVDGQCRRMLLERDWDFDSHESHAYDYDVAAVEASQASAVEPTAAAAVSKVAAMTGAEQWAEEDYFSDDENDGFDDADEGLDEHIGRSRTGSNVSDMSDLEREAFSGASISDPTVARRRLTLRLRDRIRARMDQSRDEKTIKKFEDVMIVAAEGNTPGTLILTNLNVIFQPDPFKMGSAENAGAAGYRNPSAWLGEGAEALLDADKLTELVQVWHLDTLTQVFGRRYLLRDCAVELICADSATVFIVLKNKAMVKHFWSALSKQKAPLLHLARSPNPRSMFETSGITEAWRQRKITNFEYLMHLNRFAGRSYNDITQYPVFPWVLADYKSDTIAIALNEGKRKSLTLDLTEEMPPQWAKTFRDLRKPVGALNGERLEYFLERYNCLLDDDNSDMSPFLYGSHYSSAGVVVHFLVRQEPFTTMAVNLQGGHFDVAERLFISMEGAWQSCNGSPTDVKELIPELFYDPEVLKPPTPHLLFAPSMLVSIALHKSSNQVPIICTSALAIRSLAHACTAFLIPAVAFSGASKHEQVQPRHSPK